MTLMESANIGSDWTWDRVVQEPYFFNLYFFIRTCQSDVVLNVIRL